MQVAVLALRYEKPRRTTICALDRNTVLWNSRRRISALGPKRVKDPKYNSGRGPVRGDQEAPIGACVRTRGGGGRESGAGARGGECGPVGREPAGVRDLPDHAGKGTRGAGAVSAGPILRRSGTRGVGFLCQSGAFGGEVPGAGREALRTPRRHDRVYIRDVGGHSSRARHRVGRLSTTPRCNGSWAGGICYRLPSCRLGIRLDNRRRRRAAPSTISCIIRAGRGSPCRRRLWDRERQ